MRCTERIVFALGPLGETGEAAALTQGANAVATSSENFVRIGLVTDIPDKPVGRRIENIVQGNGEFDDTEPGAEMSARPGDSIDGLVAQLVCQLLELIGGEIFKIARKLNAIEQGGF